MTECIGKRFDLGRHAGREVTASFDGNTISSDSGVPLLAQVDRRLHLIDRLAGCFRDERNASLVTHKLRELLAQRVYAIALGYEDLNDHEQLRHDPPSRRWFDVFLVGAAHAKTGTSH